MDITGKLVVAAVTHTETRIWATDAHRGDKPEVVARPAAEHVHHHVRQEQTSHGHETNRFEHPYLEGIAAALAPAGQILLVGHGRGNMKIVVSGVTFRCPITVEMPQLEDYFANVARQKLNCVDNHEYRNNNRTRCFKLKHS